MSLTPTPPANALAADADSARKLRAYPLDLHRCVACGLIQLGISVDRAELFSDYRYATGAAPGLVRHFQRLAAEVINRTGLSAPARVVEIGSNDGTLLRQFADQDIGVLGVDPAAGLNAMAERSGVRTMTALFDEAAGRDVRENFGAADVILASNVLAHVHDLGSVMRGIRAMTHERSWIVVEVAHVLPMISEAVFELIYHEHLSYFSLHNLVLLAEQHGLVITDVEQLPTQGGSLRCWLRRAGAPGTEQPGPRVASLLTAERTAGVADGSFLRSFPRRVQASTARLNDVVTGLAATGVRLSGYGASARAVTLLGQARVGEHLAWIADDNPLKQGLYTPGDGIPVVSRDRLDASAERYCLLFAWNFAEDIMRHSRSFTDSGGSFILPFPTLSIS
jgi:C-methyltransferase C-terminal domain/Methyltransferase domain/Putative zinc binding domain